MPVQPDIALGIQSPNPGTLISSMLDIGQKGLDLQKAQQTFQPDVEAAQARAVTAQQQAQQSQLSTLKQHYGFVAQQMLRLVEALEEHDDVQHVYANFDIDESEIQAAVGAN